MQPTDQSDVIRAAGGLLWRQCGEQTLVAVIHRTRYDGDWTLPKGKLKDGEPWHEAALREVQEETGSEARLLGFAGAVAYEDKGRPKVVRYWHMAAQGQPSSKRDKEVAEVVWLPIKQAVERLQYPTEKSLLEQATPPHLTPHKPHQKWRWLPEFLQERRLRVSLEVFAAELDTTHAHANSASANQSYPMWYVKSKQLVEAAKEAHRKRQADAGWRFLKAADRISLYGLKPEALTTEARAILNEGTDKEKTTSSWRRVAVADLLADKDGKLKTTLTAIEVARAKRILDEQQDNVYHKLHILKRRLQLLTVIAVVAVGIWVAWSPLSPALDEAGQLVMGTAPATRLWLVIILTGILGALVSGFSSSMARDQRGSRIPAELLTTTVTLARISLAMLTSLAVSIFLISGLISIRGPGLGVLLAAAFASGFSERLLMRALDTVS
jgi:ADP-ribose pyrophosphatase YjhB (NUDIX family)